MAAGVAAGVAEGTRGVGATTIGAGCGAGTPCDRCSGGGGLPGGGGLCGGGGGDDGGGGEGEGAWFSFRMPVDCRMISWVCRPAFASPLAKWHPSKTSSAGSCKALRACDPMWACGAGHLQEVAQKAGQTSEFERCLCSTGTAFEHSSVHQAAANALGLHIEDNLLIAEKAALSEPRAAGPCKSLPILTISYPPGYH